MSEPEPAEANSRTGGLLFGMGAYGAWGLFPAFFPLLKPASAVEVLAHRIVWTLLLMLVVVIAVRRLGDLRTFTSRTWLLMICASGLISINWVVYIYAVNNSHVVDAALGYFINPMVSVAIGVLIFGERLNRAQLVALAIAAVAVTVLTVEVGTVPYIALVLACSFGMYGAVKKVVPVDPRVSVGLEAGMAAPIALAYLVVLQVTGHSEFGNNGPWHVVLTVLCGPLTAIPLLFFAAAAQRLPLVTMGLLQYSTPALQLTWGVVVGHEPMPLGRWIGFALIWLALAVFSVDAIYRTRRARSASQSGAAVTAKEQREVDTN
ncbi:MAG: EamA family transporter RarD [Mycobacterium sp.]